MFLNKVREITSLLTPREARLFYALLVASILTGLLQAMSVVSLLPFIQTVMEPSAIHEPGLINTLYGTFEFSSDVSFLIFLGVVVLALILISGIASSITTWLQYRFVWGNNYTISRRLLANYLNQPYEFFMNRSSADFTKNILDEVNAFSQQYMLRYVDLITGIAITVSVVGMMVVVEPTVTLVGMVIIGGAYGLIFTAFRNMLKKIGSERLTTNRLRFTAVSEAFGGIKDVKLLGNEEYFLDGYSQPAEKYASLIAKSGLVSTMPKYLFETVAFGCMVALTLFILSKGEDISGTIPLIAVFAFAAYRILPQLQTVYSALTQTKFYDATLENIKNELDGALGLDGDMALDLKEMDSLPFENVAELRKVSYWHPNVERETLLDLNISIPRRQSIGIVGATGAGKTTLVDVILGLLVPQEGEMWVDDTLVDDNNRRMWQNNLGYVPQFIYLSDCSVTRNIAFGIPDEHIDMDRVRKAARIARIDEFVENELPDGYETLVGERGIRLSGGQRQRVGIARALYRDPEVLVLDEATSSLDGLTEQAFISALEDLSGAKTLIVVAHRFNTIKDCDHIYVLDKGRIVAEGDYEHLMVTNESFRRMANQ
ncbi:MAG: ABC transporter ATP-binding protein [Sphaerochaeta sp.]